MNKKNEELLIRKLRFKEDKNKKNFIGNYDAKEVWLCNSSSCEHRCIERKKEKRLLKESLGYRPKVLLEPIYNKEKKEVVRYIAHFWPSVWFPKEPVEVPVFKKREEISSPSILERLLGKKPETKVLWEKTGSLEVDPLSIVNLGGIPDRGGSATAYCNERTGKILIVDWGMKVPTRDPMPEAEGQVEREITPDQLPYEDFLLRHREDIEGIIITHIHADHAWAITELSEECYKIPIFVTPFAKAVLTEMIKEKGEKAELPNFVEFKPDYNSHFRLGEAEIMAFPVNHSTPEACGLFIQWGGRRILHLADFKLTGYNESSKKAFLAFIKGLAKEPIDILSLDAIGAHNPGFTPPEEPVIQTISEEIKKAPGRVILVVFSTNLYRIQKIAWEAAKEGRWVSFWGRSMEKMVSLAQEKGIITLPQWEGTFEESQRPERQVWIATGSQTEPGSQLVRAAQGAETSNIRIQEGDTIIVSAKPIPGNELAVAQMITKLRNLGAKVITWEEANVHVSGHGSSDDIKTIIKLFRPVLINGLHAHRQAFDALKEIAAEIVPQAAVIRLRVGKRYEVEPVGIRILTLK